MRPSASPRTFDSSDPFGRRVVRVGQLTPPQRIALLMEAVQDLSKMTDRPWAVYLGQALDDWLERDGSLEERLGVRPPRGSRARPAAVLRRERVDALLLALAKLAGSDEAAVRMLQAPGTAPAAQRELVDELRMLRAPESLASIGRARRRSRDRDDMTIRRVVT
jgi:hypothetical protein